MFKHKHEHTNKNAMSLRAFFKMVPFGYVAPGVLKSKPREDLTCTALETYFTGHVHERGSGDRIQRNGCCYSVAL
jgi:hypothetical protein